MNKFLTTVVFAFCVSLAACHRTPDVAPYPTSFSDQGASALNRLSEYFQKSVVTPKLRENWSQLQGNGAVAMDFTYRKSGDTWTFEKVAVTKSTLSKEQEAMAQRSMEESAHSSSFPMETNEALEKAAEQFVVRLAVPVPLPTEGTQLTSEQIALIKGTGGGGLGGDAGGCSECVSRTEYPYGLKCESRSSGGHLDCKQGANSNICSTLPTTCLHGIFSGSSGVIMY
jgi:hypothetical protein